MVMDPSEHEQLVQQLDQRQDDVLERLDELDQQISRLISIWTQQRDATDETSDSNATPGMKEAA